MNDFNISYLGVMVDMAGCPNRCRHCWRDENGHGIGVSWTIAMITASCGSLSVSCPCRDAEYAR